MGWLRVPLRVDQKMMIMGRNSKRRRPGRGRIWVRTLKMAGIRQAERNGWAGPIGERYLARVFWANSGKMHTMCSLQNLLHIGVAKWKTSGKWTWVLNAGLKNWSLSNRRRKVSECFGVRKRPRQIISSRSAHICNTLSGARSHAAEERKEKKKKTFSLH